MKTRTTAIGIGSLLMLLTLLGVAILIVQTLPSVEVNVRITPFMLSEEDPPPDSFRVTLSLPKSSDYKPADIDPDTVKVEGLQMLPKPEDWDDDYKLTNNFFAFKIDGTLLYNIVLARIWHMAPPPGAKADVTITVTGQFYDTTAFQGTWDITFMTLHASPPPPPL